MTESKSITGRFEWDADGSLFFYPDVTNTSLSGWWKGDSNWQSVSASGGMLMFEKTQTKDEFILSAIIDLKLSIFLDNLIKLIPKILNLHV